jgi:hypothetical protein
MGVQWQPLEGPLPGVDFISPWAGRIDDELEEAVRIERHAAFRSLVFFLLRTRYPWLVRILESAGAQILARQGAFYVAMPSALEDWIPIPELGACLHLVPWQEDGGHCPPGPISRFAERLLLWRICAPTPPLNG